MNAKTHKWIVIGIFAVVAVIGLAIIATFIGAGSVASGRSLPFKRVAVVRLEGVITESAWHVDVLREHLSNRNVAGVLLRIDSPGGAVAPSQELYGAVAAYRDAGKPIVVSMGNVAASGGYYIAAPADKIFALPGTLTGSIGVIFTLPAYQELAKKIGIDFRVLKAGDLKDAGSPYRPMDENERTYLQALINDTHEQFITDVANARKADIEEIRAVADGRVFTGRQAYEKNIIDTLGGYAEALNYLRTVCDISESVAPLEKKPAKSWREIFMESAQKKIPGIGGIGGVAETVLRPAGLYYLFLP